MTKSVYDHIGLQVFRQYIDDVGAGDRPVPQLTDPSTQKFIYMMKNIFADTGFEELNRNDQLMILRLWLRPWYHTKAVDSSESIYTLMSRFMTGLERIGENEHAIQAVRQQKTKLLQRMEHFLHLDSFLMADALRSYTQKLDKENVVRVWNKIKKNSFDYIRSVYKTVIQQHTDIKKLDQYQQMVRTYTGDKQRLIRKIMNKKSVFPNFFPPKTQLPTTRRQIVAFCQKNNMTMTDFLDSAVREMTTIRPLVQ